MDVRRWFGTDDEMSIIDKHTKRDKMKNLASVGLAIVIAISMAGCASNSSMKLEANNQTAANNAQQDVDEIICKGAGGNWDDIKGYCTN